MKRHRQRLAVDRLEFQGSVENLNQTVPARKRSAVGAVVRLLAHDDGRLGIFEHAEPRGLKGVFESGQAGKQRRHKLPGAVV